MVGKDLKDWHRAEISAALKKRGTNVSRLSLKHYGNSYTLYNALRRSYPKGEWIIARALRLRPEIIWPSRYEERPAREVSP